MADQKEAFQALSSVNRGATITLTSVSLLIVAIIFVAAKFGSAIYFKQRRTAVNTPIWVALILAIIQVVLLQKAVDHGLGKHQHGLGDGDIQAWNKFAYAAHILRIVILSLSKMSTILLIWRLTPSKSLRRICAGTAGVVMGWSIFAVFGIAFQCEMSGPWLYSPERCAGEVSIDTPEPARNCLDSLLSLAAGCHILPDRNPQHPHGGHPRRPTLHHDAQRPDGLAQASEDPVLLLRPLKV